MHLRCWRWWQRVQPFSAAAENESHVALLQQCLHHAYVLVDGRRTGFGMRLLQPLTDHHCCWQRQHASLMLCRSCCEIAPMNVVVRMLRLSEIHEPMCVDAVVQRGCVSCRAAPGCQDLAIMVVVVVVVIANRLTVESEKWRDETRRVERKARRVSFYCSQTLQLTHTHTHTLTHLEKSRQSGFVTCPE